MKVKELINILSQVDPEKEVIIKYTDHTDYTYTFDFGFDDEDVFINTEGSPYGDDDFENDAEDSMTEASDDPHNVTSNPVVDENKLSLPTSLNEKLAEISPSTSRRSFDIRSRRRRHNRSSLNVY